MGPSDKNNIDWRTWYDKHKHLIPDKYKADFENNLNVLQFLFDIYYKTMRKLTPVLKELMFKQYPVIKAEKRPIVAEYIDKFINSVGSKLLFKLNALLNGQKEGVTIRERYPKFDDWAKFYGSPQKPKQLKENDRNAPIHQNKSDNEWKQYKAAENIRILEFHNWKEKRKSEFIGILQAILFENYKELEELNADELIIYAVDIYDEYEYYLLLCERIEMFIDCGFPKEHINISDKEFYENCQKLSPETRNKITDLRNRRIARETT